MIMSYLFRFDSICTWGLHQAQRSRQPLAQSRDVCDRHSVRQKITTKNGTRLFHHILQTLHTNEHPRTDVANGRSDGAADLGIARLTVRQPSELDLVTANAAVYLEKMETPIPSSDDNDGQQDF